MSKALTAWRDFFAGWFFILVILGVAYHGDIASIKYKSSEDEPVWTGGRPAGEIIAGYRLQQPIELHHGWVRDNEFDATVCFDILFATYMRHSNRGSIVIRLKVPDRTFEQTLNVAYMSDNDWQMVCFDNARFRDVYEHEAMLEIDGVDSPSGKGVTAWLSDLPMNPRAFLNGQKLQETLVVKPYLKVDDARYVFGAWGLMILCGALLSQLLVTLTRLVRLDRRKISHSSANGA